VPGDLRYVVCSWFRTYFDGKRMHDSSCEYHARIKCFEKFAHLSSSPYPMIIVLLCKAARHMSAVVLPSEVQSPAKRQRGRRDGFRVCVRKSERFATHTTHAPSRRFIRGEEKCWWGWKQDTSPRRSCQMVCTYPA